MPTHRHDLKSSTDGTGNIITSHGHGWDNSTGSISRNEPDTTGLFNGDIAVSGALSRTTAPKRSFSTSTDVAQSKPWSLSFDLANGGFAIHSANMSVANAGSGGSHNNMMPFETCYAYKRLS